MKKIFTVLPVFIFTFLSLTGCGTIGDKSASLASIYGIAAFLSMLLLIGCYLVIHQNRAWFFLLFSSVLIVNIGYTLLAVSGGLEMALHANRVAYLGSVFLPLSMLMIILNITNTPHPSKLSWMLLGLAAVIFLLTASPGILDVYYKEVSFEVVNGVSTLVKVYGPLHPVYLFYLIGYFTAMVVVIIRSNIKKTINSTAYAVIIASAVFVNIGVWFTEQMVHMDFEMLSISYLISELFLLVTHLLLKETQQVKEFIHHLEASLDQSVQQMPSDAPSESDSDADLTKINTFLTGLGKLTSTENAIYNAHISRMTTKEILANMNIKENTLKYHNRNLYGKLGVSSKKELVEVYKQISTIKDAMKK